MNDPGRPQSSPRSELELWQREVRDFCEETRRQLQQLSNELETSLRSVESHASMVSDSSQPEAGKLNEQSPQLSSMDDRSDNARNRLENLKRQLSEKLKQSVNDTDQESLE